MDNPSQTNRQDTNKDIAELLRSVAAAYLLQNEIRFKIIAYEKAADTVEHLARELRDIWEEGSLKGLPGIGTSIRGHLEEYFSTGRSKHFDTVLGAIPSTVFQLMKIPSIGPKKAFKLVKTLELFDPATLLADLKKAAMDGKIRIIESFGEKSEKDVLEAIELYEKSKGHDERMPLPHAHRKAEEVIAYMKQLKKIKRIDALGSMRRRVSTIGDIDIAVCYDGDYEEVIKHFVNYPKKIAVDNAGNNKASLIIPPNIRVDLRVQDAKSYGSMLQYFTGSKAHNVKLREYALKKGYSLSEWGIKKVGASKEETKEGVPTEYKTEEEFYDFIGVPYIEPEIREGTNEIETALKGTLPKLVELKNIKGDLHLHSSYDLKPSHDMGANTYEEIVQKAAELGYEYVGFADHNPKQAELTKDEVVQIMKKRKQHIDRVLKGSKIGYFIGLEIDILPDGSLPLPEEGFQYVDYLVVSLHSSFRQPKQDMTKRVLKALSHPKVRIFGHPTARLINKRPGVDLDWAAIFEHVKKHDQAIEINSWPERLDLPDILVREAVEAGVKLVIDTDAHANDQMDNRQYGISVAKRGWAGKNDIINTLSLSDFKKWLIQ